MDLIKSYSKVAHAYAEELYHELDHKPKDRQILDQFAALFTPSATVCDLGCGPGQVAYYLHKKGLNVTGIDIAPGMIEVAKSRNPDINFEVGNILTIPRPDASLSGVVAFYSLIHISKPCLPAAFNEIKRVLRSGGYFLFTFHIGDEVRHADELWGQKVNLDFNFFLTDEIRAILFRTGFEVLDVVERPPYESDIEVQTDRAYFLLRKRS